MQDVLKVALIWLLLGMLPTTGMAHQFYISVTSIEHEQETQRISVRVKIFVNDLEESIFQEQGVRLGIWADTPIDNAQLYVQKYLSSRLLIAVNESPIPLRFINLKVETAEVLEDNVMICQLEAHNVPEVVTMNVYNSILTETFDAQTNIINIRTKDRKRVINLDRRLLEDQVSFK